MTLDKTLLDIRVDVIWQAEARCFCLVASAPEAVELAESFRPCSILVIQLTSAAVRVIIVEHDRPVYCIECPFDGSPVPLEQIQHGTVATEIESGDSPWSLATWPIAQAEFYPDELPPIELLLLLPQEPLARPDDTFPHRITYGTS
jgi:hypothetical protein